MKKILFALFVSMLFFGCVGDKQVPPTVPKEYLQDQQEPIVDPSINPNLKKYLGASVKPGDVIGVTYTLFLQDGTIFDTSGPSPIVFTLGSGKMISGFEEGIIGMHLTQKRKIVIPPEKAYGEWSADNLQYFSYEVLTQDANISLGDEIMVGMDPSGKSKQYGTIIDIQDTNDLVIIDANHKLAGQTLLFEVQLISLGRNGGLNG